MPPSTPIINHFKCLFTIALLLPGLSKFQSYVVHDQQDDPSRKTMADKRMKTAGRDVECLTNLDIKCNPYHPYRTADGSCNNLQHPAWGASSTAQLRLLGNAYDDKIGSPRTLSVSENALPSPRQVSNIVHSPSNRTRYNDKLSLMVMQWGQFLSHEIILTSLVPGTSSISAGHSITSIDCFPIEIPEDDKHFDTRCMGMIRSKSASDIGCVEDAREQINQATSFIDASNVYGSNDQDQINLRTGFGGLLRTDGSDMLPASNKNNCIKEDKDDECLLAGDTRVNVLPSLGEMHLLFVLEHNRIARKLALMKRFWDDETVFQETRKIVAAEMQHITYVGFLPCILGADTMQKFGLKPTTPDVGVAAFRFGHSQVPHTQGLSDICYKVTEEIKMETQFHNPHLLRNNYADELSRWLVSNKAPESDRFLEKEVRDLLFLRDNTSLDLASINIQRGRDHGIPPYNDWRRWCNLTVASHFNTNHGGLVNHTQ
ncbi:hypothetical protein ScPMuIL_003613 [Solemya velum]